MIGLDTNVLARYILQDDELQSPKADRAIESLTSENPGWIGLSTLLELVWVLSSTIRPKREEMASMVDALLTMDGIVVEQAKVVKQALDLFLAGRADFADCLIAASARAAGCSRTVTFDRVAARDAGMELIG